LFMFLYLGLPAIIAIPSSLVLSITLIREDPAAGWALLMAASVPLYSLLIAPLLAEFIRIVVIRRRLYLADADAVLLARGSEPLATALTKMEVVSSRGLNAARASAHLWTVDPFREAGWLDRLWPSCHPPMSERVALLAGMGAGIPISVLDDAHMQGEQFSQQHQELVLEHRPDSRSRIFGLPDDEPNDSIDSTAEIAFRLTATTTPVFEQPDTSSRVVQRLSAGALVTVREVAGRFLAVIMQDERFGYISDSAPREPVPAPGLGGS
jgi:hypothetical protein